MINIIKNILLLLLILWFLINAFGSKNPDLDVHNLSNKPTEQANENIKEPEEEKPSLKTNITQENISKYEDKIEKISYFYDERCYKEIKEQGYLFVVRLCPMIEIKDETAQLYIGIIYRSSKDYIPFSETIWNLDDKNYNVDIPLSTPKLFKYGANTIDYFPVDYKLLNNAYRSKEPIVRLKNFAGNFDYKFSKEEKEFIKNISTYYQKIMRF